MGQNSSSSSPKSASRPGNENNGSRSRNSTENTHRRNANHGQEEKPSKIVEQWYADHYSTNFKVPHQGFAGIGNNNSNRNRNDIENTGSTVGQVKPSEQSSLNLRSTIPNPFPRHINNPGNSNTLGNAAAAAAGQEKSTLYAGIGHPRNMTNTENILRNSAGQVDPEERSLHLSYTSANLDPRIGNNPGNNKNNTKDTLGNAAGQEKAEKILKQCLDKPIPHPGYGNNPGTRNNTENPGRKANNQEQPEQTSLLNLRGPNPRPGNISRSSDGQEKLEMNLNLMSKTPNNPALIRNENNFRGRNNNTGNTRRRTNSQQMPERNLNLNPGPGNRNNSRNRNNNNKTENTRRNTDGGERCRNSNWRGRGNGNNPRNWNNNNTGNARRNADGPENQPENRFNDNFRNNSNRGRGGYGNNSRNRNNNTYENTTRRRNADDADQEKTDNTNKMQQPRNYSRKMGFLKLQEIVENDDVDAVILQLSNDRTGLEQLLDNKSLSDDMIILIVRLMANICKSAFPQNKVTILTKILQSRFIEKLTVYITSLISQTSAAQNKNKLFWNDPDILWNSIITWCKTVNQLIPSYSENIRSLLSTMRVMIQAVETAKNLHFADSIHSAIDDLLKAIDQKILELELKNKPINKQKVNNSAMIDNDLEPPEDFREISVIPSAAELRVETRSFLRQNIVQGAFKDINHYLDIQFRLLREDFVAPLRRGIVTYLENKTVPKDERKKLDDIKVYEAVKFLSFETKNESICYKICFNTNLKKRTKISYENSKRFMFGSLVCFTSDNFETILFGKIVDRDIKLLEQEMIVVGFEEDVEININMKKDYVMVESTVYFEPYYRVLTVLQEMNIETFPMERYIIQVKTVTNPPKYLQRVDQNVCYSIDKYDKVQALSIPSIPFYGLNEAQISAFRGALMNEFSIIQGPPGTGKTFLGLKIAETLIRNKIAWYQRTPILVICYTNHALDQFLEGLIPVVGKDMLRVGSRSKNEALNEYNLAQKRSLHRLQFREAESVYKKRKEMNKCLAYLTNIDSLLKRIHKNEEIIDFKHFRILNGYNNSWFAESERSKIYEWLLEGKYQIVESVGQDENPVIPEEGNDDEEVDDYFEDREIQEIEEQIFGFQAAEEKVVITDSAPMASLEQLKNTSKLLEFEISKINAEPENLGLIFQREDLEQQQWEVQTNLNYIQAQLRIYQDPKARLKPDHVDLKKPSNMGYEDRWKLYFYWIDQYIEQIRVVYEKENMVYRNLCKQFNELREIDDTQIMRNHLVVGMTTTCAARLQTSLQAMKPRIVIVEEAAEILESHIIAALTDSCEHLILIGDHLQLKPSASDFKIERVFHLGVSLFERMVNNNIKCHTLNVQHRMRPELSRLIKPHIYPHLEDHETTLYRDPILGIDSWLYFIDHQQPEEFCSDASKKNIHESKFLIALAKHLILNGYEAKQITILAAYLGQFFEMRKEKLKHKLLLRDVKICVLDNYQGEESDIILLSLVRNNREGVLGFLRTQNRVCVALSRARNGMFVMGNMELLLNAKSENEIWQKVNDELVKQKAIGSHLSLRCQVHRERCLKVSQAEDFYKIGEGGCDLICNALLSCEHFCKSLCHILDRDHTNYNCMENCTRLLCDSDPSHTCRKKCYETCGPCKYIVPRILERCGHTVQIFCHTDVDTYKCVIAVDATLPCGHKATKPCHQDIETFICPHPCDTRVEPCGHQCKRNCHVRFDPDHLKYKCTCPCGKPRIDCANTEEPHICQRLCYQECDECNVDVQRFRSCGHRFKISCKLNIEEMVCEKPCKIKLPCGHVCKSTCSEPCAPCKFLVNKTIPGCYHEVKIECSKEATRALCQSKKCPRLLACGHPCTNSCKNPCTSQCKELVDCQIRSPCGHIITRVNCYLKNTDSNDVNLLKLCNHPCNIELQCGHKCRGTCGKCMQSRIHLKCAEKCGVPLVCNHLCPIPCRVACRPCTLPCEMKCVHSKCKKKCGETCTPCKENCTRNCEHVRCGRFCGLKCNVDPCTKRCKKIIKCGHPCVGFCGDPCPILCRICNKDELTEIFFGDEDEDDAIFVQLKDCGHIFEHTGLEQWLENDKDKIQFKKCPRCTTNITTTQRYSNYSKEAIEDVVQVKRMSHGEPQQNDELRETLIQETKIFRASFAKKNYPVQIDAVFQLLDDIRTRLAPIKGQRIQPINRIELHAIKSKIQYVEFIDGIFKDTFNDPIIKQKNFKISEIINTQFQLIISVLYRAIDEFSKQENADIGLEIQRLQRIIDYMKILNFTENPYSDVGKLSSDIKNRLLVSQRYSDETDEWLKINLKKLAEKVKSKVEISDKERLEIVRALAQGRDSIQLGAWYKCPNGHPYAIGECGGAMQIAKCFCGAQIGGTNHHLLETNQFAGEMDGAQRHVWPGGLH